MAFHHYPHCTGDNTLRLSVQRWVVVLNVVYVVTVLEYDVNVLIVDVSHPLQVMLSHCFWNSSVREQDQRVQVLTNDQRQGTPFTGTRMKCKCRSDRGDYCIDGDRRRCSSSGWRCSVLVIGLEWIQTCHPVVGTDIAGGWRGYEKLDFRGRRGVWIFPLYFIGIDRENSYH